jgi:pimeloyl-ACP methyl ester carboxylesterase
MAPFALFHGVRFDGLAAPGFRVVTYDPRGRGRSAPVTPDRVSLSQLHSDFDAVGRAVGVDAVAAIGWSGAGMELFVLTNPPLLHHPVAANELPDVCVFPNEYPPALQRYFGALFRHIAGFD